MPLFPNTAIRASAGSGKTYQLVNRYLELLAAGQQPQGILATTFTRKAAGEIQSRVLLRLARAALDETQARDLSKQIQNAEITPTVALQMLSGLLRSLHRLRISTLDAFFTRIASSFSLELGLTAGWSIMDDVLSEQIRGDAVRNILSGHHPEIITMVRMLTKGDVQRSVSEEIHSLIIELYSIFLETDREAWHSLKHRPKLTAEQLENSILALEGAPRPDHKTARETIEKDILSLREARWNDFISESGITKKIAADDLMYSRKQLPQGLVDAYKPLIEHAAAEAIGKLVDQTHATYLMLEHYDREYRRLCKTHRGARFEDVTRLLADSNLAGHSAELAHRMSSSLRHLLIDEFQDTSVSQWQVMRPVAKMVSETTGSAHSFFCVGDKKQAIYGWRGGSSALFDALIREIAELNSPSLATSFRSSPVVIEIVNRVFEDIAHNKIVLQSAPPAADWAGNFETHSSHNSDYPGYVRIMTAPLKEEGGDQDNVCNSYAAQQIRILAEQSPNFTIGVLVRKNKTVGDLISELGQLQVAASEEGGNPLSESPAVEILLSALTLADHPGDGPSRFHIVNSLLGLELGMANWNDDMLAVRTSLAIREHLMALGYGRVIRRWADIVSTDCSERDKSRLSQLVDLAFEWESQQSLRPTDFVNLVRQRRVQDPSASKIRVMTVHQAKGLEFDIVVLPELDEPLIGQSPAVVSGRPTPIDRIHLVTRYAGAELQTLLPAEFRQLFDNHRAASVRESLCVLYVAMTRAAHSLHIVLNPSTSKEGKPLATFAGVLRSALGLEGRLEPELTLLEVGDPNWFEKEELRRRANSRTTSIVSTESKCANDASVSINLAPQKAGRARGLMYMTPSGMEGGNRVSLTKLLEATPNVAFQRGTVLHALFESIEWLDKSAPTDENITAILQIQNISDAQASEMRRLFSEMISKPSIRQALSQSEYGQLLAPVAGPGSKFTVFRERRFAVETEVARTPDSRAKKSVLSGAFDRLVLRYESGKLHSAEILDYKTDTQYKNPDQPLVDFLKEKSEFYRPQLAAYGQAVSAMTGLPMHSIRARLLFVSLGEVVPVDL